MKFSHQKLLRITKRTKTIIRFKYLMNTPTSPSNSRHPQQTSTAADNILNLDSSLSSNSIVLDEVKSDKYRGVILDNKLSFYQHIDEIVNKITKLLNLCRRNLHMCDHHTKEIAYKTIACPHLEYASTAWNPYTARTIDKIESVQRRAARFILRNYNYGPDSHSPIKYGARTLAHRTLAHRTLDHRTLTHRTLAHLLLHTFFWVIIISCKIILQRVIACLLNINSLFQLIAQLCRAPRERYSSAIVLPKRLVN